MKQVYYFVFLAVLALTSAATKADTPVKIKVDDAARVTVKVNYAPVAVVTGAAASTSPNQTGMRCSPSRAATWRPPAQVRVR